MNTDYGGDPHIPKSFTRAYAIVSALFFDSDDRLLVVNPTYKANWDVPGGFIDRGGETPNDACRREIREELGLEIAPLALLAVDWAPSTREGDRVFFLYDCGVLTATRCQSIRLQAEEIAEYEFVDLSTAIERVVPGLARRLEHSAAARKNDRVIYLEHGRPVF